MSICVFPWFIPFLFHRSWSMDLEKSPLILFDENQNPIQFQPTTVPMKIEGWMGEEEVVDLTALEIADWLKGFTPRPSDSILVTIKDWRKQEYIRTPHPPVRR